MRGNRQPPAQDDDDDGDDAGSDIEHSTSNNSHYSYRADPAHESLLSAMAAATDPSLLLDKPRKIWVAAARLSVESTVLTWGC
jgi:membrane-associated phospholipid phosphatase